MYLKNRNAFTMLELIFVIVVIGILSAVAIPKFAVNRDDAVIAKAKATVSAVRSALATERQKRILRGDFTPIYKLSSSATLGNPIFDAFDGNTTNSVLAYAPVSCATDNLDGCWKVTTEGTVDGTTAVYTFNMPLTGTAVFELTGNRFNCQDTSDLDCQKLTR